MTIILGYNNDLQYVVRQTGDKVKMLLITTKSYSNLLTTYGETCDKFTFVK